MAKFSSTWLARKRQFRSLTGVEVETFHKMTFATGLMWMIFRYFSSRYIDHIYDFF